MIYKMLITCSILLLIRAAAMAAAEGPRLLGSADALRQDFKPYDLVKLNYLGMNYCENLLDMRVNTPAYTHLGFDAITSDAWHLHFPDDAGRMMEGIAWEDQYSPVVRLELMRRMVKGMLAAHVPGTKSYYFFRHRSGGKSFLISDDSGTSKQGRLSLVNWNDSAEDSLKVGFRVEKNGVWHNTDQFTYTDTPEGAASLGLARSPRYWNQSPYTIKRHYVSNGLNVDFTGRYWLSDEDMPLEYGFQSKDADNLLVVIGEPGKPMALLGDPNVPAVLHLPDRSTTFASDLAGDKSFTKPDFHYMIVRKPTAFASPGYSTALLVMWKDQPETIEALAPYGYGEIRLSFGRKGGKVWLLPFQWVNSSDMDYIHQNAQYFLKHGKLKHNGHPSQQLVNAAAAGLASGAYLLSKYGDPLAVTARINAANAVDQLFDAEKEGMRLVRVFHVVKAAAWMVKTGQVTGDQPMVAKYTPLVDQAMRRMLSESGYDGKGWASGWDHFNAIKAAWLAYDATGNREYLAAYERAQSVYTIDAKGIYRYGVAMQAPGGFETYSGALPLGAWGHAGRLDDVHALINLDVPNGWNNPTVPLKDIWNDTGAGPWAQDDANPEYLGYALKGANIPQKHKYLLPLGAFPVYDASDGVKITRLPMVDNPYFPLGHDKPQVVAEGQKPTSPKVVYTALTPGSAAEKAHLHRSAGKLKDGKRVITAGSPPLIYQFHTTGSGAGIDLRLKGRFRIDVSPDGLRWYTRRESWSSDAVDQSVDLSAFTGSHDELLQLKRMTSPIGITKLELVDVTECWLELIVTNGYRILCSTDGKIWQEELSAKQFNVKSEVDAGWLRFVNISKYLGHKSVYVKLADTAEPGAFESKPAALNRLTVYGVFNSGKLFVRLTNTSDAKEPLYIEDATYRSW